MVCGPHKERDGEDPGSVVLSAHSTRREGRSEAPEGSRVPHTEKDAGNTGAGNGGATPELSEAPEILKRTKCEASGHP